MRWTLNRYLFVLVAAIFLIVTIGGTALGLNLSSKNNQIMVTQHLEDTSGVIGLMVAQQERNMRGMAASIARAVELGLPRTDSEQPPVEEYFSPLLLAGDVDSIHVVSSAGEPLLGIGPFVGAQELDLQEARNSISLSSMITPDDQIWLFSVAPVRSETATPALLVAVGKRLDEAYLNSLDNSIGVGVTLTANGVTVSSSTAKELAGPDGPAPAGATMEEAQINNGEYGALTTALSTGQPGTACLSVIMATDDVTNRVWMTAAKLIGAIWGGGILAFVALALIARSITNPIKRMALQAESIARGEYGKTMPVKGVEEIRTLKRSFNQMSLALRRSYDELSRLANTDALTGLRNHRRLQEALLEEMERSRESGKPVAVIVADIDNFKLFNSTHGYAAGDKVIKLLTETITGLSREGYVVGRHGGDKFMVIAPQTNRRGAKALAERLRKRVSVQGVRLEGGRLLPLRLSIGIAVCPQDSANREELLAYVDASLFEAKRAGGNAITLANRRPGELYAYQNTTLGVLDGLVRAVDKKDRYTKSHSEENAEYAMMLGRALGLSENTQSALRIAGLLHDIGKIGIPDQILKKPGALTPEEREIVQRHVVLSELIIKGVPHSGDVTAAVANHHERWDGTGYPQGLKGEEIPLLGRIMAVVDSYSAITSDRPFRKAQSHRMAVAELRKNAGSQFDPTLVEVFIDLLEERGKDSVAA